MAHGRVLIQIRRARDVVARAVLCLCAALASMGAAPPKPDPAVVRPSVTVPPAPLGWSTVWADDFTGDSGTAPSSANWIEDTGTQYPGGPPQWGTGEVETMSNSTDNVQLDGNGHLTITPIQAANGTWTSGRIETQRSDFAAPPGGQLQISASIQQPNPNNGLGYWPAFWMLGSPFRGNFNNWPGVGEIDVMEDVNGLGEHAGTFHCGTNPGGPCNEPTGLTSGLQACSACQTSFHTYSVIIDRTNTAAEQIRWYLDGVEYYSVLESQVGTAAWQAAVDHGFFLLLDVAMGGSFPNAVAGGPTPTNGTSSGAAMSVGYVAVYVSPPTVVSTMAPLRVADTRQAVGPIEAGQTRCFGVVDMNGIPADASAVVLNVAAVGQTTNGWLTVFPNGQSVPSTSTLNFGMSQYAMANGTIMPVGTNGEVCVFVGTVNFVGGGAQVIIDETGFVSASPVPALVMLSSPQRLEDSRLGDQPLQMGMPRCFTVAGVNGIPSDAAAVLLNVAATNYSVRGWLTLYPNGQSVPQPETSTVNFDTSEYAVANNTVMRVGSQQQVCVRMGTVGNVAATSDIVIDATGYLSAGAVSQLPMLSSPQRVVDTRQAGGPIPTGGSRCFAFAGQSGIPANAAGLVVNVTAVDYSTQGWLTVFPSGQPPSPSSPTSTLNFDPSEYAIANGALVALGSDGKLCVSVGTINSAPGSSDIVIDVVGSLLR